MTDNEETRDRAAEDDELPEAPRRSDRMVWVGLFVILGLIALLGVLFTMTSPALFRGRYIVFTTVPDAGGIRRGDPVQMRGVNIGRVLRLKLNKYQSSVTMRLEIEVEYEIPKDSRVELHTLSLLSGLVAEVKPGKSDENVPNGGSLPGFSEENMMETVNRLTTRGEELLKRMDELVSPEMVKNVHQTTTDLRATMSDVHQMMTEQKSQIASVTASLKRTASAGERIAANTEQSSSNVRDLTARPELGRSVERFDTITTKLNATSESLDKAIKSLDETMTRIDQGQGTLGKLTRDDALYNNLNQAAKDLSDLTKDIKAQPKKYINLKVF